MNMFDPLLQRQFPGAEFGDLNAGDGSKVTMTFSLTAFAYLVAMLVTILLIFFAIHALICIDELKNDYKNPIDQCKALNNLFLPEFGCHVIFNVLFLVTFQFGTLACNAPLIIYHLYRYAKRPVMSGPGLYDPTTILNSNELSRCSSENWTKLAFYVVSFFYYLFSLIYVLVTTT